MGYLVAVESDPSAYWNSWFVMMMMMMVVVLVVLVVLVMMVVMMVVVLVMTGANCARGQCHRRASSHQQNPHGRQSR